MSDILQQCEVCNKPAEHKCGGCYNAFYCNKEHQKSGWKIHKKDCKPFKVSIVINILLLFTPACLLRFQMMKM